MWSSCSVGSTIRSMEKENPIRQKSYEFAFHTVLFCKRLMEEKKEYVLSKQLLRSGTSIGANVEEGVNAPSKKDFINKLSISLKEAFETRYWICLIRDSGYRNDDGTKRLLEEVSELIAILTAIIKSSRKTA